MLIKAKGLNGNDVYWINAEFIVWVKEPAVGLEVEAYTVDDNYWRIDKAEWRDYLRLVNEEGI